MKAAHQVNDNVASYARIGDLIIGFEELRDALDEHRDAVEELQWYFEAGLNDNRPYFGPGVNPNGDDPDILVTRFIAGLRRREKEVVRTAAAAQRQIDKLAGQELFTQLFAR